MCTSDLPCVVQTRIYIQRRILDQQPDFHEGEESDNQANNNRIGMYECYESNRFL
jgi:hypothetical protein